VVQTGDFIRDDLDCEQHEQDDDAAGGRKKIIWPLQGDLIGEAIGERER